MVTHDAIVEKQRRRHDEVLRLGGCLPGCMQVGLMSVHPHQASKEIRAIRSSIFGPLDEDSVGVECSRYLCIGVLEWMLQIRQQQRAEQGFWESCHKFG